MSYKDKNRQREYCRQWVAKRRADWFADKSCIKCGSTDHLELDHIDPSTKVSHSIWSWSKVRRDEEIMKCQVLCRSCHLVKTIANDLLPYQIAKHGGYSMYRKHGCRCELCIAYMRKENSKYR